MRIETSSLLLKLTGRRRIAIGLFKNAGAALLGRRDVPRGIRYYRPKLG
jgi:hypothetical protein